MKLEKYAECYPLHFASMNGDIERIKYLLDEKNIPVNSFDNDKRTALFLLKSPEYTYDPPIENIHEIINLLEERGGISLHIFVEVKGQGFI